MQGERRLAVKLCLAMLICLVSCKTVPTTPQPEVEIGDGGFLTQDPCGPPCLWGIVPGRTTEAELLEILRDKGILSICEAYNLEEEGGLRGISCGPQLSISFERNSDIVRGVGFVPSVKIKVEDVLAKYGEPDGVLAFPSGTHREKMVLVLVYLDMLAWIGLPEQTGGGGYLLTPDTPVETIDYDVHFGDSPSNIFWRAWNGYQEYH